VTDRQTDDRQTTDHAMGRNALRFRLETPPYLEVFRRDFRSVCEDNLLGRFSADGHQFLRPGAAEADADLRGDIRQRECRVDGHSGRQGEGAVGGDVHPGRCFHTTVAVGRTHVWISRVPLQNSGTARSTGL